MTNPGAVIKFTLVDGENEYSWTKTLYGNVEEQVAEYKQSRSFDTDFRKLSVKYKIPHVKSDGVTHSVVKWVKRHSKYDKN